jgi:hypothetical protein
MEGNQETGVTHYVSVSVERGQVKTSCSAHLTVDIATANAGLDIKKELAEAMARSMAVASMATQTVVALLSTPMDDAVISDFLARCNRIANETKGGG